ncbi:MAG: PilZ domain-containing protein [Deltaproteobacteria bacterium]|nr:PilZ domain-containing protein [Deltaproteobacteria bacterium]
MTEEPRVSDRLLKLVQNMSETEQKRAVNMLRRQSLRMKCLVPVDWATHEVSHTDFVRDISDNGTFIETRWPLNIGQELSMVFRDREEHYFIHSSLSSYSCRILPSLP